MRAVRGMLPEINHQASPLSVWCRTLRLFVPMLISSRETLCGGKPGGTLCGGKPGGTLCGGTPGGTFARNKEVDFEEFLTLPELKVASYHFLFSVKLFLAKGAVVVMDLLDP